MWGVTEALAARLLHAYVRLLVNEFGGWDQCPNNELVREACETLGVTFEDIRKQHHEEMGIPLDEDED